MNKKLIAAVTAITATVASLHAEGYQINTLSAKQEGMGHTGVALRLGTESQFFNPAGLGFMDSQFDASASLTGISATAKATLPDGTTWKTDNGISTPISASAAFSIYDNFKAGIAFYTPYGSSIKWGDNWPGAVLNQSVSLKVFTIQPTFAWRIIDRLSIGAGLTINWGNVDLNKGLVTASTTDRLLGALAMTGALPIMGIDPDYRFGTTTPASINLKGSTRLAVGFNVGAMFDISDRWTVGAQFRSRVAMKVNCGDASLRYANTTAHKLLNEELKVIDQANFRSEMPCPYVLAFGVSYRPAANVVIAADAQLTGWKTYRALDIEFLDDNIKAFNQHIEKNYSNAWAFKAGVQWGVTRRLDLRAGVMVDTDPVSDVHYNPETPGMTKINPSVGLSFRPVKGLSFDVAFVYVAGLGRDNASCTYTDLLAPKLGMPAEATFTADYKVHAFVPSVGVSYSF